MNKIIGIQEINVGSVILEKLKENERTVSWLAKKIGCDESYLRKKLKNNQHDFYCNFLLRISDILDEDFFVYYSQKLTDTESR